MENGTTITVTCNHDEKIERLLRRVLHQLEDIYVVLDSFDDISDVVEGMKSLTENVKQIGKR